MPTWHNKRRIRQKSFIPLFLGHLILFGMFAREILKHPKFNIFNQISATDYCFSVVGISFLVRAKHGSKQIQMELGSEENELLVLVGT